MNSGYVWVEKYRPVEFDQIVLNPLNKQILGNIIESSYFPNLLFYGPPGTGKTTTIINLIYAYQVKLGERNKDLVIHLNASDERGIDIIRNQINLFVNSKPLFHSGTKFVILDEVDYMTKNAQQALRYLLQSYTCNVRFCLICNYISKIDEGLQNEFIRLRFNQLPQESIIHFLQSISEAEHLGLSPSVLASIQKLYKSDIRSMINFMQSNQDLLHDKLQIIDQEVWEQLLKLLGTNKLEHVLERVHAISIEYNIDKKNIIKDFFNYLIRKYSSKFAANANFLEFAENLMHSQVQNQGVHVSYALSHLKGFL